jgi:hypothetical protein
MVARMATDARMSVSQYIGVTKPLEVICLDMAVDQMRAIDRVTNQKSVTDVSVPLDMIGGWR